MVPNVKTSYNRGSVGIYKIKWLTIIAKTHYTHTYIRERVITNFREFCDTTVEFVKLYT